MCPEINGYPIRLLSRFLVEAFAAIVGDGRVVTWGHPNSGGVCALERENVFPVVLPRGFGEVKDTEKKTPWNCSSVGLKWVPNSEDSRRFYFFSSNPQKINVKFFESLMVTI